MRKVSEKSLGNVALFYLRRYSASRAGLVQVLERKVKLQLRGKDAELVEAKVLIERVVDRMAQAGYLDDTRLAESKTASLHRQGKSSRTIEMKLRQKGISPELARKAAQSTPERELEAAGLLVKKKRLGADPERKHKDLAVLMRAGFKSDVARRALQAGAEEAALAASETESEGAEVIEFAQFASPRLAVAPDEGEGGSVVQLPVRSLPTFAKKTRAERGPEAASALVKKKRLGVDPGRKQKDLAVLIRAGFSYDVAKQALAAEP